MERTFKRLKLIVNNFFLDKKNSKGKKIFRYSVVAESIESEISIIITGGNKNGKKHANNVRFTESHMNTEVHTYSR